MNDAEMIQAAELARIQDEAIATEVVEADDYIPAAVELDADEIPF